VSRLIDRLNELSRRIDAKVQHEFRFQRKLKILVEKTTQEPERKRALVGISVAIFLVIFVGLQMRRHRNSPTVIPIDVASEHRAAVQMFRDKNFAGALERFQKILEIKQDHPVILNNIGVVLKYLGEFKRSEEFLTRSTEIASDDGVTLNNLGMLKASQGRFDEAFENLNQASEKSKTYLDPLLNLAWIYESQGQYRLAGKTYERFLKNPTASPLKQKLPERIRRLYTLSRMSGEKAL
jgi:tetratricopeptide (TPR) repeat protein